MTATQQVALLVKFFRSDVGRQIGEDGDADNLSPAQTAIRAMKELIVAQNRLREIDGPKLQFIDVVPARIQMILTCPECRARHVDKGEFATKPHHTHACQACGFVWRPAVLATVGVQFLPGFKDEP